ncbi:hypothetical protein BD410DRAFT_787403 [Rickenella mellea]|uniref:MARVEL domain-containing protein n=1 Tax=Rickenella mellea TaxID=50990 RepID=A0A4Y7Q8A4_9AGAM|nr:hypothetical protein BD410DRAFT_787403 [Rickenella mellea]
MSSRPLPANPSRPLLILLAFASVPSVMANCYIDNFGNEVCNTFNHTWIGVGISLFAAAVILSLILAMIRRRRIQRANMAYVTQAQHNQNSYNPSYPQQQQWTGSPPYTHNTSYNGTPGTQYPPQAYSGGGYDATNAGQYSAPTGPPPPPAYGKG